MNFTCGAVKISHRFLSASNGYGAETVLSETSKERCVKRMLKMKSLRPAATNVTRKAAVLIPLVEVQGEVALLYTKRSNFLTSHRGQVSFPGGNSDPADGSLIVTALREMWEEVGLAQERVNVWGCMPELASSEKGDYTAVPVVGAVRDFDPRQLRLSSREVDEAFCIKLSQLANPRYHGYTQFRIKGKPGYSMPVYFGPPHPIWGLTAIMTFQLLKCLLPSHLYDHRIYFQSPLGTF